MEKSELLNSPAFRKAVSSIQKRAEKQSNWSRLADVFVRTDLWDRAHSPDSQLVLGRRGTGKTHLFRVFHDDALSRGELSIYVDCTRLGSGFNGLNLSPDSIAGKYFTALLNEIGTELLDHVIRMENPDQAVQNRLITKLTDGLVPHMDLKTGIASMYNYRQISDSLGGIFDDMNSARAFLILDEWAQVPYEAQPIFAEFIKRALLTISQVCLKVLAVNYQCQFSVRRDQDSLGLERGADIPDVVDMDRYLVFDEKRQFVADFFAHVLYKHLGVELGWALDVDDEKKRAKIERLFTAKKAFVELVRAAEGNTRDFLCVFSKAFFEGFRQDADSRSISIKNVELAAASWYEQEKASTIATEPEARQALEVLVNQVLRGYKSRTFLVESSKVDHPRLRRLLNERLIHRLNGTYSHRDRPGVRHDLLTIDYGVFVRLRGTSGEVQEEIFLGDAESKDLSEEARAKLVPRDDKRSIRRIVFDPAELEVEGDTSDRNLFAPREP